MSSNNSEISAISLSLYEQIYTRRSYSKNKIPQNQIINFMTFLDNVELQDQITSSKNGQNNFINAIETLSFDVANYIFDVDSSYAVISSLWTIMITLINSKTETENPLLFMEGYQLFCKIVDIYDEDKIQLSGLLVSSNIHTSTRFISTIFADKLIQKGLKLNYHHNGITPLIYLISNTINSSFNKDMFDLLMANGSSIDEIARDDDVPGHKFGFNRVNTFAINKTPGLTRIDIMYKNVIQIIKMAYEKLFKYGVLSDNLTHPIYKLLEYFNISIEILNNECLICMFGGEHKLEKLKCGHELCMNCAIEIQIDDIIICPFCREVNNYIDEPYMMTLFVSHIGEIKVRKEITMKELIKICQNKRNYKYISLMIDFKSILPNDKTLKDMGIKNNSSITCIVRLPHQLTETELAEWNREGTSLIIG